MSEFVVPKGWTRGEDLIIEEREFNLSLVWDVRQKSPKSAKFDDLYSRRFYSKSDLRDFLLWWKSKAVNKTENIVYEITPVPKPRMTQSDKWKKRPATEKYWSYCDELRLKNFKLPESGYHIIFVLPMPNSWSKKKKAEMDGKPHQQKPDKDNLEKAVLDAIFEDDSHVWDGRVSKVWGTTGKIIVNNIEAYQ